MIIFALDGYIYIYIYIYINDEKQKLASSNLHQVAKMIQTQFSKENKVFRRDDAMDYCDSKILSFHIDKGTLFEFE